MTNGETPRHCVVFDCNVYLDVADLLGPPFAWENFHRRAAQLHSEPVPHMVSANDSLRALAVCLSGRFAGEETLEVWTSSHIDTIVRGKAEQPNLPDATTGYYGLGWTTDAAQGLLDNLVTRITEDSGGGSVGDQFPDGNPPLDHEDGMVYGACRSLAGEDPLANVYCVTQDREFVRSAQGGQLGAHTRVMRPARFVQLVKAARASLSMRGMLKQ